VWLILAIIKSVLKYEHQRPVRLGSRATLGIEPRKTIRGYHVQEKLDYKYKRNVYFSQEKSVFFTK
jgi:hypothetical protein